MAARPYAPSWLDQAACGGMTEWQGFSDSLAERAIAVRVCRTCPVLMECRAYAEKCNFDSGVWGGIDLTYSRRKAGGLVGKTEVLLDDHPQMTTEEMVSALGVRSAAHLHGVLRRASAIGRALSDRLRTNSWNTSETNPDTGRGAEVRSLLEADPDMTTAQASEILDFKHPSVLILALRAEGNESIAEMLMENSARARGRKRRVGNA